MEETQWWVIIIAAIGMTFCFIPWLLMKFRRTPSDESVRSVSPSVFYDRGPLPDCWTSWELSLAGIAIECDAFLHDRIDLLPPRWRNHRFKESFEQFLREHRIDSQAAWEARLRWLQYAGHRRMLALLRDQVQRMLYQRLPNGELEDPDTLPLRLDGLAESYGDLAEVRRRQFQKLERQFERYGLNVGLAYDINLCVLYYRIGVQCGYISEKHAVRGIAETAKALTERFDSWQHYGEAVVNGYDFFENDLAGSQAHAAYVRLCEGRAAPWQTVGWQPGGSNQALKRTRAQSSGSSRRNT